MAMTLAEATERAAIVLGDVGNLKWSAAEVAAGLAQALGEMSLAAGQALTLAGLEGAAATTLPATLERALVTGAAGWCAVMRAGAKADWESQSQGEPQRLAEWGDRRLVEFRAQLGQVYRDEARLHGQRTSSAPWAGWADDFGERGRDELC
jgi:hypothetical protein